MHPRLTQLNDNEILLYLGYRGQACSPELEAQMHRCADEVCAASEPRWVYRRIALADGAIPGLPLEGQDIRDLLQGCQEAVLLAATLGPGVERLMMRSEVQDMGDAVLMDACASAAIENVCDHFEYDLREELEAQGLCLTDRFSPGYGDLPLHHQAALCAAVDAQRRIGLTVTQHSILVPRKSVTAVLGIGDTPRPLRARGCEVCSLFRTCRYRKEGITCHG